jgi:hypothetical protein
VEVKRGFAVFLQAAPGTEAYWRSIGELDWDIPSISSLLQQTAQQARFKSAKEIIEYF